MPRIKRQRHIEQAHDWRRRDIPRTRPPPKPDPTSRSTVKTFRHVLAHVSTNRQRRAHRRQRRKANATLERHQPKRPLTPDIHVRPTTLGRCDMRGIDASQQHMEMPSAILVLLRHDSVAEISASRQPVALEEVVDIRHDIIRPPRECVRQFATVERECPEPIPRVRQHPREKRRARPLSAPTQIRGGTHLTGIDVDPDRRATMRHQRMHPIDRTKTLTTSDHPTRHKRRHFDHIVDKLLDVDRQTFTN